MRTTAIVWLLFPALASVAAPALKEKNQEDRTRILGVWAQESISLRGEDPQGSNNTSTFKFDADGNCGITIGIGRAMPAVYSLDPQSSPRRMKWLNGPEKSEWICLYELTGDTLKVAFVDQGTEPPTKLEPARNLTIYYLRRVRE
ncbi:MAG TPA: hypothetical protein VHR66_25500 [Gemmataceae bacterium]|jgi:uncharacterized protein (TIGR03067 family)|nr:hypothetical protein [Gemmataceae bacterium]